MTARKNGTSFKPGISGNPNGRPKLPEHIKKMQAFTTTQFVETVCKYIDQPEHVLEKFLDDRELPAIDRIIAKFIFNCGKSGNYSEIDRLLNRLIGPVKQTAALEIVKPFVVEMLDGSEVHMGYRKIDEEE